MGTDTKVETCRKVSRIQDIRVELSPPSHCFWSLARYGRTEEGWKRTATLLKQWADELREFYRDHRSQDDVEFNVVIDRADMCDKCGREWETDTDANGTFCTNCGKYVVQGGGE